MGLMEKWHRQVELRKVAKYSGRRRSSSSSRLPNIPSVKDIKVTHSYDWDSPQTRKAHEMEYAWHQNEIEHNMSATIKRAQSSGGFASVVTMKRVGRAGSARDGDVGGMASSLPVGGHNEGVLITLADEDEELHRGRQRGSRQLYADPETYHHAEAAPARPAIYRYNTENADVSATRGYVSMDAAMPYTQRPRAKSLVNMERISAAAGNAAEKARTLTRGKSLWNKRKKSVSDEGKVRSSEEYNSMDMRSGNRVY
ncbi:hypothetical protein HDV00_002275 [Rhizophlyctis rosea]|nr:hypothetical protein HDV00_002275 [Rhizophlyctis rosea]